MSSSKYLKAILEYDLARLEVVRIKKPLFNLFFDCDYGAYPSKQNCIKLKAEYDIWEKTGDEYGLEEPEYREPCDKCKQALHIFEELKPAKQRFGVAKVRLSRLARDYRNSFVLTPQGDES